MRLFALGFLLGIVILQQLAVLPVFYSAWQFLLLPPLFYALLQFPRREPIAVLWILTACLCGAIWHSGHATLRLQSELPFFLEKKTLLVTGKITSLPVTKKDFIRFDFAVQNVQYQGKSYPSFGTARLKWYTDDFMPKVALAPDQQWSFYVSLKRPHGLANPFAFQKETYLFQQNIRAVGYVRTQFEAILKEESAFFSINSWRWSLWHSLKTVLPPSEYNALIPALSLGITQTINDDIWRDLRDTGTIHLLAISGLHIGFAVLLGGFFGQLIWRLLARIWPPLLLYLPSFYVAVVCAMGFAVLYAALAGFSFSTQRALIMVTALMLSYLLHRQYLLSQRLAIALLAVLLWDPFAALSSGFWFSFVSVATILYVFAGKLPENKSATARGFSGLNRFYQGVRSYIFISLIVFVGILSLTLLWYGQVTLLSPIANPLIIPVIGFWVVPLSLLTTFTAAWLPELARLTAWLALWGIEGCFWLIETLLALPYDVWYRPAAPASHHFLAFVGILIILLGRTSISILLGGICCLPLLFPQVEKPQDNQVYWTVLDVGQGLSVLIETQHHVLLYDTGHKWAGRSAVVPYLRGRGIQQIDKLMISHEDADHMGGAVDVLAQMQVKTVSSTKNHLFFNKKSPDYEDCRAGQTWTWDGVKFEVLHPSSAYAINRNEGSCVLKITAGTQSMLLTGDIGEVTESTLLRHNPAALSVDIVVVPHHGSRYSSSGHFIEAMQARYAVVSAGYLSRHGHPAPVVSARYRQAGTVVLNTAQHGALSGYFGLGQALEIQKWRTVRRRYWQDIVF